MGFSPYVFVLYMFILFGIALGVTKLILKYSWPKSAWISFGIAFGSAVIVFLLYMFGVQICRF